MTPQRLRKIDTLEFAAVYDPGTVLLDKVFTSEPQDITIHYETLVYLFPLGKGLYRVDAPPTHFKGYLNKFEFQIQGHEEPSLKMTIIPEETHACQERREL